MIYLTIHPLITLVVLPYNIYEKTSDPQSYNFIDFMRCFRNKCFKLQTFSPNSLFLKLVTSLFDRTYFALTGLLHMHIA